MDPSAAPKIRWFELVGSRDVVVRETSAPVHAGQAESRLESGRVAEGASATRSNRTPGR